MLTNGFIFSVTIYYYMLPKLMINIIPKTELDN